MSKYDNWTFLSLNPVNQRFQSSNHIQIGFSAWISESQFVDVSSFRNFWVFVFDITIGHFFTNTSIQFVKYPKLYFAYFVEFEFFGCLYCSLEGTCQYNSWLFHRKDVFICKYLWYQICVFLAILWKFWISTNSLFLVKSWFSMPW